MERYLEKITDNVKVTCALKFATMPGYDAAHTETELFLDVYEPANDSETNRKAVLFVHGGGFLHGTRDQGYPPVICKFLAERGYVCFSIDYRLYPSAKERPSRLEAATQTANDVELARKWILERAQEFMIDPNWLAVGGGSAGGLASIQACKLYSEYSALLCLWGARIEALSDDKFPPTIFVHGTADELVPFENCKEFYNGFCKAGIPCRFVVLEGAPHTPMSRFAEFKEEMVQLLYSAK